MYVLRGIYVCVIHILYIRIYQLIYICIDCTPANLRATQHVSTMYSCMNAISLTIPHITKHVVLVKHRSKQQHCDCSNITILTMRTRCLPSSSPACRALVTPLWFLWWFLLVFIVMMMMIVILVVIVIVIVFAITYGIFPYVISVLASYF